MSRKTAWGHGSVASSPPDTRPLRCSCRLFIMASGERDSHAKLLSVRKDRICHEKPLGQKLVDFIWEKRGKRTRITGSVSGVCFPDHCQLKRLPRHVLEGFQPRIHAGLWRENRLKRWIILLGQYHALETHKWQLIKEVPGMDDGGDQLIRVYRAMSYDFGWVACGPAGWSTPSRDRAVLTESTCGFTAEEVTKTLPELARPGEPAGGLRVLRALRGGRL